MQQPQDSNPTMATKKTPPAKVKNTKAPTRKAKPKTPPVPYDKNAVIDKICARLATGETLRSICRDETMPAFATVYLWMENDPAIDARIARARELGEEAISQQCLEIADDATRDFIDTADGPKLDSEHVQRSKLRIWTRLELLKRWNPRKWGDKVDLSHGVQPDNPLADLFAQVAGTPIKPKA